MSPPDYPQPLEPILALGPGTPVSPALAPAAPGPNTGGSTGGRTPVDVPVRSPVPHSTASPPPPDARTIQAAVDRINARLAADGQALQLAVDPNTGRRVIFVRDANTGALIRQIPSEDALRIASALEADSHSTLLLDLRA